jgi:hypothetical protein
VGTVKVRNLDPVLVSVNGEFMHVSEEKVARGVEKGIWEVAEEPELKEMTVAPGAKGYDTKEVLSFRDMYGEDRKR